MKLLEQRFRQIFRENYPTLCFYATRLVGDEEASDVVQEAFMELWKRRDDIADESHVKAFLYRSIYTRGVNIIKHRCVVNNYSEAAKKIEQYRMDYYHFENNDVSNYINNTELRKRIDLAIEGLPEKSREVFVLSYLQDKKNKEIAEQLGISVRTVEVHLYRALKSLREKLKGTLYYLITFFIILH